LLLLELVLTFCINYKTNFTEQLARARHSWQQL